MSKPIIGITIGGAPDDPEEGIKGYQSYAMAVEEAGGEPRFLHLKPLTSDTVTAELPGLDGIIFTGGIDVHPDNYDARNEPGDEDLSTDDLIAAYHMHCSLDRDAYELPLARAAYDAQIPILGICRGFQLLNVALGGSLVKDIRTGRKHWSIRKDEEDEGEFGVSRRHMVTVVSGTKFAKILGDCPMLVNSRHHQGIMERHISPQVRAAAVAPDGIIEAIEAIGHPWAVAVQWHPERKADDYVNEPCKPLFTDFIATARDRRAS